MLLNEIVFSKIFQDVFQLNGLLPLVQRQDEVDRNFSFSLINFSYKFSSGKCSNIKGENRNWEFLPVFPHCLTVTLYPAGITVQFSRKYEKGEISPQSHLPLTPRSVPPVNK